jgi:hypothetical protein
MMVNRKTKQLISPRQKKMTGRTRQMMLKTMKRAKVTRTMIQITGEEMELRMVIKKMKPMMQEKMRKTKIMMKKAKGKKNTDF